MIRLGLRLTFSGGKEALLRLVLIAVAVAIGVGLLLTTLAGINAVNKQNARYAWLETGYTGSNAPAVSADQASGAARQSDPLWWRLRADYFHGTVIGRVDVAATGPNSPMPPGIAALPGPGQFYASPALAKLLRNTPGPQLGDRFPGSQIGTIGSAALPAPNSLIIIIGHSAAELSGDGAQQVARISTTVPSNCTGDCAFGVGINDNGITLVLSVVIAALLFPVLIFIGGATRLSAARRDQRFAAMRLVGATPRQTSVISTVESTVASVIGVALGFAVFALLRHTIAGIPFTGDPFFPDDLSPTLVNMLAVALGIPVGAAIAARIALRRVNISPLGVTRRQTPTPPRAWRLIPLTAGLAGLGYLANFTDIGNSRKYSGQTQAYVYLTGVLVVMTGLVLAGPWLTMLGARFMARRANRPAGLIAGRRLADNPKAGFRAISGLVIAVFVGTLALGVITTIQSYSRGGADTGATRGTVISRFWFLPGGAASSIPVATLSRLTAVPGVTGVTLVHVPPGFEPPGPPPPLSVSCAELTGVPALGHCPAGADTATINLDFGGEIVHKGKMSEAAWPAAALSSDELRKLPVDTMAVGTDGSAATVEQVRSVLDLAYPRFSPQTISEIRDNGNRMLNHYQQLANVVILVSLPIAGCSLAVSVAGGLAERKRPFSLLRLTGTPLRMLRNVVTLEAAAPLLLSAFVSAGTGLLAARLILQAQLHETLVPPSAQYYLVVVGGLVASLAVIASTLPLLNRITGPETARSE